jgi:hypothetical protein
MKLLLIISLMITTTAFAQSNTSPARKEGACFASLILQDPPASGAQQRAAKHEKYRQAFGASFKTCQQKGVDPANDAAFNTCLKSTGINNDNLEYMIGFLNNSRYIRNNRLSNYDISMSAVQFCTL